MSTSSALLDTLASYVPARVARRIAAEPAAPTTPTAERFSAAILFADISGFTQIAERMAGRGLSGGVFHCHKAQHNHIAIALPQAYNQV